jgi:predicted nucleic acid-binding protein
MFLDTSGLLCLFHKDEPHHQRANELFKGGNGFLIHNYVLAEFVALASKRGLSRALALKLAVDLTDNEHVGMVWVDSILHRASVNLLMARADKKYSLCDAVSFVLMRMTGVFDALSTDHHFEQEGFHRLLKPTAL